MPDPKYDLLGVRKPRPGDDDAQLVIVRRGVRDKVIFIPLKNAQLIRLAQEALEHVSA